MSYLYNFPHCPHCVWNFYKLQEYQKREAEKHRRKIILPCVIPWEYGTNKYASQKGSGGFGSIRNATTKIQCSRPLSESNDGVVPRISCPSLWDKELASQAGLTPFGGIREHAIKVQDREGEPKKDINKLSKDHKSESILKIWSRPNPHANATQQIGKPKFFGFFLKFYIKKARASKNFYRRF
ncbi:unnamed protein product [Dracunculus medinensis]|uniref:Protein kinase domain-containing protein n=1 Tax=Dracunculus medinensis TaxID=318479 RepID=A0A158Q6M1_DRAME|nr:unnamed protein product [Dracunculus medinensis]